MSKLSVSLRLIVAFAIVHGAAALEPASAPAESLLNCNQVELEDRCDCNRRVLRALLDSRVATSDPVQSPNSTPPSVQDAVQQEYRHRLRTFIAPGCDQPSSPENLPVFEERSTRFATGAMATRFQPLFTRDVCLVGCDVSAKHLLEGRWGGWQTLSDGKPSPLFLHVIEVRDTFVRACSNNGMVFGVLRGGFLEFPGTRSSGLAYGIRLWRGGPPRYRELEGVALLDLRPNQEAVAGLVWLTRAQKRLGSLNPAGYFCEDRELEDIRTGRKPPELTPAHP